MTSCLTDLVRVRPVIKTFLTKITVARVVPQLDPLVGQVRFVNGALFIPVFLVSIKVLISPVVLVHRPRSLLLIAVVILARLIDGFLTT